MLSLAALEVAAGRERTIAAVLRKFQLSFLEEDYPSADRGQTSGVESSF